MRPLQSSGRAPTQQEGGDAGKASPPQHRVTKSGFLKIGATTPRIVAEADCGRKLAREW